ncbi:TIR domain-containing protein [Streptomyces sp. NPDC005921]|uniref:TIR domain-containing protein n=1 Tax=Streptomyces sp. NPDC005827 TaxID=3157070 RepID=UPI0033C54D96
MTYSSDLRAQHEQLKASFPTESDAFAQTLNPVDNAIAVLTKAWSGSNIGYQSRVYHADFTPPPPGSHFSKEWGLTGTFQGTTGRWVEYSEGAITEKLRELSQGTDLSDALQRSVEARQALKLAKAETGSILSSYLQFTPDEYIEDLRQQMDKLSAPTPQQLIQALRPEGMTTRDATAINQGWQAAEHQKLWSQVTSVRRSFAACREMLFLLERSVNHIDRRATAPAIAVRQTGERVFIGHGGSGLWRVLKDFVTDRLNLPYDEFNRVPVAGVTTVSRLGDMLDRAAVAFLVLTAEDETADGKVLARQNVIHEVGLFQGRLGFERAIVMLEEGCEEFSNINGLSQIRFPKGDISARFEEVRQVLEREGLLESR